MADSHSSGILEKMSSGNLFSDLTFICRWKFFPVHKVVACAQSDVLMTTVQKAEAINQKSGSTAIDMSNFEPQTVEMFIKFLYTGDYASTKKNKPFDPSEPAPNILREMVNHIHCHQIASHYQVYNMKKFSNLNLRNLLQTHSYSSGLVSALPSAVKIADSLDVELEIQDALAASFGRHIDKLTDDKKLNVIRNMPGFSTLVLAHCGRNLALLKDQNAELEKRAQERAKNGVKRPTNMREAIQWTKYRNRVARERRHSSRSKSSPQTTK
ncbi:BTB/POZ fold domain containing protein [Cordyceps militaris CM01]|uniref:BTB/POZ fold domain containing protein n=1 Tax=Cordyceps militaris (strain CM01) TaxID=983644 RepID=G3JEJ8_CORMM|nr:BTB/POZ fold domain containing protein [Cordyceps militaris CM01]EGX93395.1 BTB/POZ fold domain containing protein [Cordyceps militaris CM01]